jgi:hypothetical protein
MLIQDSRYKIRDEHPLEAFRAKEAQGSKYFWILDAGYLISFNRLTGKTGSTGSTGPTGQTGKNHG